MAAGASARLAWAAELAAPRPGDQVLEVGCGHGVLLSLIADRLTTGLVVGLDRSAAMTAAAAGRNASAVARGRVAVRTAELLDAGLGAGWADLVVAVHVGAFWRPPAAGYGAVREVLAATGRFSVRAGADGRGGRPSPGGRPARTAPWSP